TPDHVKEAAMAAIRAGKTKYPPVAGIPELKAAIQRKFQRDHALSYGLDQIMVCSGAKQVISNALLATINPGDEVIVPTPCWVSYPELASLCGGTPVPAPGSPENNY